MSESSCNLSRVQMRQIEFKCCWFLGGFGANIVFVYRTLVFDASFISGNGILGNISLGMHVSGML